MKVDGFLNGGDLAEIGASARLLEEVGYDGVLTAEVDHDPFLPLAAVATNTDRVQMGTSIAVAFARNPMTLANVGHDLQTYSRGRFRLGLGSQIKPHIEKRFSMPWSHPARRMRELVLAVRAIWRTWNEGEPLRFRGEFYRHFLMTPMFDPGPSPYGPPPILLAGVGPHMTEVAGEVADGMILHAFTTEKYVREVTVPALERGFARGGRTRDQFEIVSPTFTVTGTTEEEIAASARATKQQLAFYGSTPAYRPVLELHGWSDLGDELNRLSKQGEWVAMGELVDDDVLRTFAVVGSPDEVADQIVARYGDLVDRMMFGRPASFDRDQWAAAVARLQG